MLLSERNQAVKFTDENGDIVSPKVVETVSDGRYTGRYRLIGVPGGFLDLPGRGGRVTYQAAHRAIQLFKLGWTNGKVKTEITGD